MEQRQLEAIFATLSRIERKINTLISGEQTIMTTQAEFDTALTALLAAEATRDAAVTAALNDLIAKVSNNQPVDLSAELAQIATLQTNAAALTQTATADDPGATTVPTTPIAS
jgi:hypothetical protein